MTPKDLPIACSLTALEMPVRLAEMASVGQAALVDVERAPRSATLRFRAGDATRTRLEAIVAAEADCCAFLVMELRDDPAGLALQITAPPGAEPMLDDLVNAFSARLEAA